jgi:hypothetical protein
MKARKDNPESDFKGIANRLSKQSVVRDPDFWKEYFYWSWRCLLFVLFIVVATNLNWNDGIAGSFDHISPKKWASLIIASVLLGPAIFIGWSFLWKWGQDLVERAKK